MKLNLKQSFVLFLLSLIPSLCAIAQAQQQPPQWQSQYALGENKLAPHAYVWPYSSEAAISQPGGYENSSYYMSLNGKWKFNWVKDPDKRPKDFFKPSYYVGGWGEINVPGNWERQGYGLAIYVNETYEFDDKMFNFKKIRHSFLIMRMKLARIVAHSRFLPIGMGEGSYCAVKGLPLFIMRG